MFNLIQNENMKIYRRIRTWILIALLVAITAGASVIVYKVKDTVSGDSWRTDVQKQVEQDRKLIEDKSMPQAARDRFQAEVKVGEYRLQHDIPPANNNVWSGVNDMSVLIVLVTIFTVIVAADIVAGEFGGGTIKLLLIRPASRSKILLSKYISTLLFSLALLVILFLSAFVVNGILYGFSGVDLPYVYASKDGVVHEGSMLGHTLGMYGLSCINLLMVVTLAFMISTVFRSSSFAIGLSMLLLLVGSSLNFLVMKYSWMKYWLFMNTDLTPYLNGMPPAEGMTMTFSIIVLAVYFIVFNALSWTIFNKRDVAA
ncbi:ABC transporter permease [Paenibacillus sp. MBLB4367]|uniref:ABC transporter permease n=1 Tax=Paenibacillus sp. MBLB4367 TaxID=3384767 RepID=UPI00390837F4